MFNEKETLVIVTKPAKATTVMEVLLHSCQVAVVCREEQRLDMLTTQKADNQNAPYVPMDASNSVYI